MPWQQFVADVICEIDPATGLFIYREWGLKVPRQSGKTTLELAKAVHRARAWTRQNIAYAAQTRNDARKKWEDEQLPILEASPYKARFRVRKTNGNEAILWDNGSRHGITSGTEKSGHGPTLDEGYIDEAFAQRDGRLEQAFKPAMVTKANAQYGVLSTAGETPEKSPYLWGKVEAGRERCLEGRHGRVAYFEWSAGEDMDRADPATWWATMPALGHTITEETIRAEFESMPAVEFDRAFLNRWRPLATDSVITEEDWQPLGISAGQLDPVTFAVDVAPDSSWASIVSVGDAEGFPRGVAAAELVDRRPGTGWLIERLVQLKAAHGPKAIGLDPVGPAGALVAGLDAADLSPTLITTRQLTQACGGLLNDIYNDRILHRNDPELDSAIYGAHRRIVGDAWAWTRSGSGVDISPAVALTIASYLHRQPVDEDDGGDFAIVVG